MTPEECAKKIAQARCIVALTGAGLSTAAGIPDFRGPKGLYVTKRYDAEKVFDIDHFRRDPEPFYQFTRDFLTVLDDIEPTFTHTFLAQLERTGKLAAVITQNIDMLHQKAGSKNVVAVHGDYTRSHCLSCGAAFELEDLRKKIAAGSTAPRCICRGIIKPDVVFFGEAVKDLHAGELLAARSDFFLVLGSSLTVYPAAWLPEAAGGDVLVVNQGRVGLQPGKGRYFVDEDLDGYFRRVHEALPKNP